VPRLALFLQQSLMPEQGAALLQPNQYSQAVRYINGVFGLDYLGRQLGIAYADDFMGPLTLSPNLIKSADGKLEVTANARMPRGKTPEQLRAEVEQGIARWSDAAKVPVTVQYTQGNWMARDPKGAWLSTLLNIFGDTTGWTPGPCLPQAAPRPSSCPTPSTSARPCPARSTRPTMRWSTRSCRICARTCRCSPRCWCASAICSRCSDGSPDGGAGLLTASRS
jgi:hypothetical protein